MSTSPAMLQDNYTRVAIALHWILAILILAQIAGGWYMHELAPKGQKYDLYQLHKSFGITILLLSLARLGWRLTHRPPAPVAGMLGWEKKVAKFISYAFYALMIGVPIIGWLMVSASTLGLETKLFKLVSWPHVPGINPSEELEDLLKQVHAYAAFTMLGLVGLHVGAALRHHFIKQDHVLTRMIPFLSARGNKTGEKK